MTVGDTAGGKDEDSLFVLLLGGEAVGLGAIGGGTGEGFVDCGHVLGGMKVFKSTLDGGWLVLRIEESLDRSKIRLGLGQLALLYSTPFHLATYAPPPTGLRFYSGIMKAEHT